MTELVIRKMPFEFDDTVPFMWQPENPKFAAFCNSFTFIAVPFEKYIIGVVRKAQDRLTDPSVAEEAEAFLRQEAQHASAHRKHMKALVARYPGLEAVYQTAVRSYDELLANHPIEFHVAYIANLEATFTPLMKVILDNRESLFAAGDRRVASLMMWHFVEEIEHRSSGLTLCDHVTKRRWYRVKQAPHTFRHVSALAEQIAAGFDEHVPERDRIVSVREAMSNELILAEVRNRTPWARRTRVPSAVPSIFHAVPTRALVAMVWRLLLSQTPHHDPANQPIPDWVDAWMREYERGTDMTNFYGTPPAGLAKTSGSSS